MGDPTALGTPHSRPGTRLRQGYGGQARHSAPSTALRTQHPAPSTSAARPLLKWAGGKRQLLPALRAFYPESFGRYFEPFVGSGAVFFDLYASGRLAGARATLTDCNADLIGCYRVVRDRTVDVQRALARLARGHETGAADHFYAVRERFNRARARLAGRRRHRQLHAGTGRDADLPEPHRVQRAVPSECRRALQRAGGSLRAAQDLRPGAPGGRRRSAWYARRQPRPGPVRVRGGCGPRRRSRVLRSALRAGERHGAFHVLYCAALHAGGPHPPARLRNCAGPARVRRHGQQLQRAGHVGALRRGQAPAAAGLRVFRIPARRAINSRGSSRGPVTEFLLTNLNPRNP